MAGATICVDIPKVFFKRRKKVLGASFVLNLNYCFK